MRDGALHPRTRGESLPRVRGVGGVQGRVTSWERCLQAVIIYSIPVSCKT